MGDHIAVVEVPTNNLCCGFFIFNLESNCAVWTGDGFRTDRCGEGGAGYRSAKALFDIYGIKVIPWDSVNMEEIYVYPKEKVEEFLISLARSIGKEIDSKSFQIPIERKPYYVRI